MEAADAVAHGSEHPLLCVEDGVIRHFHTLLNPRPPLPAGTVAVPQTDTRVPIHPPHPMLTNAQLRLNYVLARRTPHNQQSGTFARVSSLMLDVDVQSGIALFYALAQNRSDATVCDLIDMNPRALTMTNTDDDTPLLVALYKKRSFQVVQHMVRQNKDVVMYTMARHGNSPLGTAISHRSDARIVAILVDENGEMVRRRHSSNLMPVCHAMREGYGVDVLKLLVYPDCADIYDRPPEDMWNCKPPLHLAIVNKLSLEVVKFVVELNRASLFMTNDRGMLALHLALTNRRAQFLDVPVIQFLAQEAPATLTMLTSYGHTPFRMAVSLYYKSFQCRDKFDDMAAVLLALRDEEETVLVCRGPDGDIPLMKACRYGMMLHPAVFRVLIGTKYATTTMTNPETQKTALHSCVGYMTHAKDHVEECIKLLCVNDIVLTMKDYRNRTPLHTSMFSRTNTAVVKMLTRLAPPHVLEMADMNGDFPLHLAVATKADDEALACLVGNRTVTCAHRNKAHNRAIEIAMNTPGVDMARMSLFMFPGMDLKTPGEGGCTLLHCALARGAQPAVISYLLRAEPNMLGVKNIYGYIPLMCAITAKIKVHDAWQPRWSNKEVRMLVTQTHALNADSIPSCRSVWTERTDGPGGYYQFNSVLHIALKNRRPFNVVRGIVDADVTALTTLDMAHGYSQIAAEHYDAKLHEDNRRRSRVTRLLLFHRVLWYASDIKILMYLAEKHPNNNLFTWADIFGNTALHMAIRQEKRGELIRDVDLSRGERPLPVSTVRYLVQAGEMALLVQDKHGNTPLHLAIVVGSNTEIMQLLIESCTPPAATYHNCVKVLEMPCESVFLMQNKDGCTPLHLAMKHEESTVPLSFIMHPCPQAMLIQDKDGCTPMHLMMSRYLSHISPDKILPLLQAFPEVLLMQDHHGRTPLHALLTGLKKHKYDKMSNAWQQQITQHLIGATAGLLTREQSGRLTKLKDAANQTPWEYYWAHFRGEHIPFYFAVVGQIVAQASPDVPRPRALY